MLRKFTVHDILVFFACCTIIIGTGTIISSRVNNRKDTKGYFLTGNTLPWYIEGSTIIAANISAEQFIGMSGSGFGMGLTITTYEWLAVGIMSIPGTLFYFLSG